MPAHNRPDIRVSSPRPAKSSSQKSPSRKTRVRQSWSIFLRRIRPRRAARWARRTLAAAPKAIRIVCVVATILAAFSLTNLVYHVVRKPSELLFFAGRALDKEPAETWRQYGPLFRRYSTGTIAPELLAALAQVESTGNPVARTYWRWRLAWNPFAVYQPASSAVGLYQMTDGAYAEARRYCIRENVVWMTAGSTVSTSARSRAMPSSSRQSTWTAKSRPFSPARPTRPRARSRSRTSPHSSISAAPVPPRPSRTVVFR